MKSRFPLVISLTLTLRGAAAFACSGNEYWQDDPKGVPVWTSRYEVEIENGDSQITDNFLRTALARAGLKPCSSVEKDLVDADVKRAIRTDSSPISKAKRWGNITEITQVMIRHRARKQANGILEVLTRTKIRKARAGRFLPASPEDQQDAATLANKIADDLRAALSR
jgi:hypothetical protein